VFLEVCLSYCAFDRGTLSPTCTSPFNSFVRQVERLRHAQMDERLAPTRHLLGPLLLEDDLPVVGPQGDQPAVVIDIREEPPGAVLGLAGRRGPSAARQNGHSCP
jgi:hypothetical protein